MVKIEENLTNDSGFLSNDSIRNEGKSKLVGENEFITGDRRTHTIPKHLTLSSLIGPTVYCLSRKFVVYSTNLGVECFL